MLERFFESGGAGAIGSAAASERSSALRSQQHDRRFGRRDDPLCRYHDDRIRRRASSRAGRGSRGEIAFRRLAFERMEKFLAGLAPDQRADPRFVAARRRSPKTPPRASRISRLVARRRTRAARAHGRDGARHRLA
jgi:hypothetical protein